MNEPPMIQPSLPGGKHKNLRIGMGEIWGKCGELSPLRRCVVQLDLPVSGAGD